MRAPPFARRLPGINAAWRERRYDDLCQMFAEDMVFTLPGFSGLLQGREAVVASYREFIERVTLTSYREEQLVVHVWGDTAVASYLRALAGRC
jgi:ketosteroid isomerase-like protein